MKEVIQAEVAVRVGVKVMNQKKKMVKIIIKIKIYY